MTPRGAYRDSLERHLTETQQHERAVARRIREIGRDRGLLAAVYGALTHRRRPGARPHQGPARPAARRPRRRREAAQERPRRGRHRGARDRHLRRPRGARAARSATTRRRASPPATGPTRSACSTQLRNHIPKLANAVVQARATGKAELRLGDHGRGRHGPQDGPQRAAQGHDDAPSARHEGREAAGRLRQAHRERGRLEAHGLHPGAARPRRSRTSAPTASAPP